MQRGQRLLTAKSPFDLYLSKGDFAGAQKSFAALRDSPAPGAREKAAVYEGLALMEAGKTADALINFDDVIRTADESAQDSKWAAQIFKAEAILRASPDAKKIAEAEKLIRSTLPNLSDDAGLCEGHGSQRPGRRVRLAKKPPKEALLDGYMWVVVLYKDDPRQWARAASCLDDFHPDRQETSGRRVGPAIAERGRRTAFGPETPPAAPVGG